MATGWTTLRDALDAARSAADEVSRAAAFAQLEASVAELESDAMAAARDRFVRAEPNTEPPTATSSGRIEPSNSANWSPNEIMGGNLVAPGQFPDCCAVGTSTQWLCTGTLIAPNLVVTARHCKNISRVFVGGNSVFRPEEGEVIHVVSQHHHPIVDLRVLVLERPSSVAPRHIAQGDREVRPRNNETLLMGFGITEEDGYLTYGEKRQAVVAIESLDGLDLSESEAKRLRVRPGFEMIAGQRGLNIDSCQGDSGGPAYIVTPGGDTYLLGVTSRGIPGTGRDCGDGGVYIRVDKFVKWIAEETGVPIEGPLA